MTVDDLPVGSIGAVLGEDVERCSAEVGYWLGESCWGRGIATRALVGFTGYAFAAYEVERLFAVPLAANTASCRVLESVWWSDAHSDTNPCTLGGSRPSSTVRLSIPYTASAPP